jgi:hypothetical protein
VEHFETEETRMWDLWKTFPSKTKKQMEGNVEFDFEIFFFVILIQLCCHHLIQSQVLSKHHHHHHHHWQNSPFWAKAFLRSFCQLSLFLAAFFGQSSHCLLRFRNNIFFSGAGCQPCFQPPAILEDRLDCFLVWVFITDQSGMGGPTSSYATASIAPWLIRPHKPHHHRQGLTIPRWGLSKHNPFFNYVSILCTDLQVSYRSLLPIVFIPSPRTILVWDRNVYLNKWGKTRVVCGLKLCLYR